MEEPAQAMQNRSFQCCWLVHYHCADYQGMLAAKSLWLEVKQGYQELYYTEMNLVRISLVRMLMTGPFFSARNYALVAAKSEGHWAMAGHVAGSTSAHWASAPPPTEILRSLLARRSLAPFLSCLHWTSRRTEGTIEKRLLFWDHSPWEGSSHI